jgi:hypothetical protein
MNATILAHWGRLDVNNKSETGYGAVGGGPWWWWWCRVAGWLACLPAACALCLAPGCLPSRGPSRARRRAVLRARALTGAPDPASPPPSPHHCPLPTPHAPQDNFDLDYKHPQLLPGGWLRHVKHHVCFDPERVRRSGFAAGQLPLPLPLPLMLALALPLPLPLMLALAAALRACCTPRPPGTTPPPPLPLPPPPLPPAAAPGCAGVQAAAALLAVPAAGRRPPAPRPPHVLPRRLRPAPRRRRHVQPQHPPDGAPRRGLEGCAGGVAGAVRHLMPLLPPGAGAQRSERRCCCCCPPPPWLPAPTLVARRCTSTTRGALGGGGRRKRGEEERRGRQPSCSRPPLPPLAVLPLARAAEPRLLPPHASTPHPPRTPHPLPFTTPSPFTTPQAQLGEEVPHGHIIPARAPGRVRRLPHARALLPGAARRGAPRRRAPACCWRPGLPGRAHARAASTVAGPWALVLTPCLPPALASPHPTPRPRAGRRA